MSIQYGILSGGVIATASGAAAVAAQGAPWWLGLAVAAVGGVGTVVGAVATWLTNRHKLKNSDADSLRRANERLRGDMFRIVGKLERWSETQDARIQELETGKALERERKHDCLNRLSDAQAYIIELEELNENSAKYIEQLEQKNG
jgi:hypothetical protein